MLIRAGARVNDGATPPHIASRFSFTSDARRVNHSAIAKPLLSALSHFLTTANVHAHITLIDEHDDGKCDGSG